MRIFTKIYTLRIYNLGRDTETQLGSYALDVRVVEVCESCVGAKRQGTGALTASFYLVDRGLWHRLPGISSFDRPGSFPAGAPQVPMPMCTLR